MIDIQKLLAECEFHIKRGDSMQMDPAMVKRLIEGEELHPVQTDRDFEAEKAAAKALQPVPDVIKLVEACELLVRYHRNNDGACMNDYFDAVNKAVSGLAKHGGAA